MKTIVSSAIAAFLLSGLLFLKSCKKKEHVDPLEQNIQKLVPQNVSDTLRILGMNITDSGKPIQIAGMYEINPMVLLASSNYGDAVGGRLQPVSCTLIRPKRCRPKH